MSSGQRWTGGRIMLGVLQAFVGVGGAFGGFSLVADRSGARLGLSLDALEASPFADYLLPGIVLGLLIGVGHLAGGLLTLLGQRRAGEVAIGLGVLLMAWIGAQMAWLGYSTNLQPSFFALGMLEILQGLLARSQHAEKPRPAR